jgi:hypothetical protein
MGRLIHPGELIATPNFNFTRDQAGLWTGTHEFHCPKNELARLIPGKGERHHFLEFLGVSEVTIAGLAGNLVRLVVGYAGFQASFERGDESGESDLAEYTLTLSTSEEPVETFSEYDSLSAFDIQEAAELARNPPKPADGKEVKEVDKTGWDPLKVRLFDDLRSGLEAYREPRVIWTKRWVSDARPNNLNRIGEIDTPEGNPPPVAAGRNWMNVGVVSRERGAVFENELSWELSGRGGWNAFYYGEQE